MAEPTSRLHGPSLSGPSGNGSAAAPGGDPAPARVPASTTPRPSSARRSIRPLPATNSNGAVRFLLLMGFLPCAHIFGGRRKSAASGQLRPRPHRSQPRCVIIRPVYISVSPERSPRAPVGSEGVGSEGQPEVMHVDENQSGGGCGAHV